MGSVAFDVAIALKFDKHQKDGIRGIATITGYLTDPQRLWAGLQEVIVDNEACPFEAVIEGHQLYLWREKSNFFHHITSSEIVQAGLRRFLARQLPKNVPMINQTRKIKSRSIIRSL